VVHGRTPRLRLLLTLSPMGHLAKCRTVVAFWAVEPQFSLIVVEGLNLFSPRPFLRKVHFNLLHWCRLNCWRRPVFPLQGSCSMLPQCVHHWCGGAHVWALSFGLPLDVAGFHLRSFLVEDDFAADDGVLRGTVPQEGTHASGQTTNQDHEPQVENRVVGVHCFLFHHVLHIGCVISCWRRRRTFSSRTCRAFRRTRRFWEYSSGLLGDGHVG